MNPSTASGRLVKDLLFLLVVETGRDVCYRCGEKVSRKTFSIEHKESWLDSEDPVTRFFDTDNIAYSHLTCNVGAAKKAKAGCGSPARYANGCRCDLCRAGNTERAKQKYTPDQRKQKYLRTGY